MEENDIPTAIELARPSSEIFKEYLENQKLEKERIEKEKLEYKMKREQIIEKIYKEEFKYYSEFFKNEVNKLSKEYCFIIPQNHINKTFEKSNINQNNFPNNCHTLAFIEFKKIIDSLRSIYKNDYTIEKIDNLFYVFLNDVVELEKKNIIKKFNELKGEYKKRFKTIEKFKHYITWNSCNDICDDYLYLRTNIDDKNIRVFCYFVIKILKVELEKYFNETENKPKKFFGFF